MPSNNVGYIGRAFFHREMSFPAGYPDSLHDRLPLRIRFFAICGIFFVILFSVASISCRPSSPSSYFAETFSVDMPIGARNVKVVRVGKDAPRVEFQLSKQDFNVLKEEFVTHGYNEWKVRHYDASETSTTLLQKATLSGFPVGDSGLVEQSGKRASSATFRLFYDHNSEIFIAIKFQN